MDTQETTIWRNEMSEQGFDCEQVNIAPNYTEQKAAQVDRATGETSAKMFINNELEGEKNKMERRHSLDNTSADYPLKEGQPKTSLTTNISRPKKLKTDGDDPTQRTRNRSKSRTNNLRKQVTSLPPPSRHDEQYFNTMHVQDTYIEHKWD